MTKRIMLLLGFVAPAVLAQGSLEVLSSSENRRVWVMVEEIR